VFVFGKPRLPGHQLTFSDGPNKPAVKRNQRVKGRFGTSDGYSIQFKRLLDACGLEWWNVS
jgi:hypothetical protein